MISGAKLSQKIRLDTLQKRIGISVLIKIGGTLLAFLLNLLLARVLGVEDYGLYSFTFTVLMAFALVGGLGLDKSSIKYLSTYLQNKQHHKYKKFKRMAYLSIVLSSFMISISMLVYHFCQGDSYSRSAFFWAALLLPIICFVSLQSSVLRAHNKISHAQIPQDLLRPLLIIVSVLVANYWLGLALGFDEILLIVVITHVLLSIIYFKLVVNIERHGNASNENAKIEKVWFTTALSMTVITATNFILYQSDIIIIGLMLDDYATGLYASAVKLVALVGFFLSAIEMVGAPMIARIHSKKNSKEELKITMSRFARYIAFGSVPICLVLLVFPSQILSLFGSDFEGAKTLLMVLAVSKLIHALTGLSGYLLIMTGNDRSLLIAQGINSGINLILNIVLIPIIGAMGAAVSTLFCTLFQSLYLIHKCKKKLGVDPSIFARHYA